MLRTGVHAGSCGAPYSRCATPRRRSKSVEGNGNGATRGPHGRCDHESALEEKRVLCRLDAPYAAALGDGNGAAVLLDPNGPEPRCSGVRWFKATCDYSQLLCGKGHVLRPASRVLARPMSEPAIRVLGGSAYACERTCH